LALGGASSEIVLAEPGPSDVQAVEAADAEQPIFEKQVDDTQKLVVTRRRVPRIRDLAAEARVEEWAKKQHADAKVTWPDRKYRYTFTSLTTDDAGKMVKQELWWFESEEFTSDASRIVFLDATLKRGGLVYVCQEVFLVFSRLSYVNLVRLKTPPYRRTIGLRLDTKRSDYFSSKNEVKSAQIEGSLKKGDLSVLATVSSGETLRFVRKTDNGKDKWEHLPDPKPKTPAQPNVPAEQ
jgi:hypothetical protein